MELELTLTQPSATTVAVMCNGIHSHTFEHKALPTEHEVAIVTDPVAYGTALYEVLFPQGTLAQQRLAQMPERIVLVASTDALDAIAWEYLHGPDGFLVLETPFVRGLPPEQRIEAPPLTQALHIVAVPSNPLSHEVAPLNIDGEWQRLKEVIDKVRARITLERTRPATIEGVRSLVAGQRNRIVHFMGHGGQYESGAILCFEKENGDLDRVSAKQFTKRVQRTVFLVTLNACVSAKPGPTHFSNLAKALVQQETPYALGMRLEIWDEDARAFSRTFYDELARGVPIEEALLQARLTLSSSQRSFALGIPVLYTALKHPASGFAHTEGKPIIEEHQPPMDVLALPRAQGTFQGRIEDLTNVGAYLTGDSRARIVTIHGSGGQGKTALAREAVERFAYAWLGGVWTISLEHLPSRSNFALELAHFLGIETQSIMDLTQIERQIDARLRAKRVLIVLDNMETLVEAVEAKQAEALALTQLLQQLPRPTVSLLITSRIQLGWQGEQICFLEGLSDAEGAALFEEGTPARRDEIVRAGARQLSAKVRGHPLGLRLLAGAFNSNKVELSDFLAECEQRLPRAEDKYVPDEHPHRTLIACIETSVRYLSSDLRTLFGGLWIFRAPFLSNIAAAIFDPDKSEESGTAEKQVAEEVGVSPTKERLYALWQRGLLTLEKVPLRETTIQFYYLLPTTRPYIEKRLKQSHQSDLLLARFAAVYAQVVGAVYAELDKGATASTLVRQSREDFEQAWSYLRGLEQARYLLRWGWILFRQGNAMDALHLLEQAVERVQGKDLSLELQTLNAVAFVYGGIGQPRRALELHERVLPILREVGDRAGEATTLSNLAFVYRRTGQWQRALELYEQALPLRREVGDQVGEATTLNNLATVYGGIGQGQRALELYEQALSIKMAQGDRAGEAATLNNLGELYRGMGQPQRALALYKRALLLTREVGDRAGETVILNNLAAVYDGIGQWQLALELYEQALPLKREVGDRAGEATTLSNLAVVYQRIEHAQRARELYEQALPIMRDVGNRAGEAMVLNNLAFVYQAMGQPQQALELCEQALPIRREVGDRAGEATTLNGLAYLFWELRRYEEAETAFERSILLEHECMHYAGEVAGLIGLADLLSQHLHRPQEALVHMQQALALMKETGLPQDAAGHTLEELMNALQVMQKNPLFTAQSHTTSTIRAEILKKVVMGTRAVMTVTQKHHPGWYSVMTRALQKAQRGGANWQSEVDFCTAILTILDGQLPTLPPDHPYARAIAAIQEGIAEWQLGQIKEGGNPS